VICCGEGEGANLIKEGKCGLVVEPENPQALAEAVIKIADNPELAKELGENGRRFVEERFSWSRIVGDWLEELEKRERNRAY
jgi:glycosyltransferase involved in cell wall biosynthesis